MADEIHARYRRRDGFAYRIWDTCVGGYITPEMDEKETKRWLKCMAVENLLRHFETDTEYRLRRAREKGTSSHIDRADVNGPWEEARSGVSTPAKSPTTLEDLKGLWFLGKPSFRHLQRVLEGPDLAERIGLHSSLKWQQTFMDWAYLASMGEVLKVPWGCIVRIDKSSYKP